MGALAVGTYNLDYTTLQSLLQQGVDATTQTSVNAALTQLGTLPPVGQFILPATVGGEGSFSTPANSLFLYYGAGKDPYVTTTGNTVLATGSLAARSTIQIALGNPFLFNRSSGCIHLACDSFCADARVRPMATHENISMWRVRNRQYETMQPEAAKPKKAITESQLRFSSINRHWSPRRGPDHVK
jgi:hypothetical protein